MMTDDYRRMNEQLHRDYPTFGANGNRYSEVVDAMIAANDFKSVIDYGCGKGTLLRSLLSDVQKTNYDPAVPEFSTAPDSADFVVCTDVLEHVEPDCLDQTLGDIWELARMGVFFVIATRPAKKTLPDGRNAHLIQADPRFWLPKIWQYFNVKSCTWNGRELTITGSVK